MSEQSPVFAAVAARQAELREQRRVEALSVTRELWRDRVLTPYQAELITTALTEAAPPPISTAGGWRVRCTVSGGVTGRRSAYLKSNGEECRFPTLAEAEAEAAKLRAARSPYGPAIYSYVAERVR